MIGGRDESGDFQLLVENYPDFQRVKLKNIKSEKNTVIEGMKTRNEGMILLIEAMTSPEEESIREHRKIPQEIPGSHQIFRSLLFQS